MAFKLSNTFASNPNLSTQLQQFEAGQGYWLGKATFQRYEGSSGSTQESVGDLPQSLITTDSVPDAPDTSGDSNPTLTVTGMGVTSPIVSTIDTIGDQDFYKLTLTAGTAYEIGLYSYNGGPNLVGLTDPYLELYDSSGSTLVVSADGGANTEYNELNSGFDVLLVYTPTVSGTYYVNARAFSNTPATSTGDSIGDYQLFAREQDPNDPEAYIPYYEPTSPLYAIDWGTRVNKINQSAANPDGDEGIRPTGNAQGTPTYTSVIDIPALAAAQGVDITDKNVITIYFAQAGDIFTALEDPKNPGLPPATVTAVGVQDFEYEAVWTALHEFEKVADVVYLEVDNRDYADFVYTSYQGTPGPGVSLLGSMSPPDEPNEGLAQFNSGDERWNERDLAQGGFSFVTLIHEFGHGHGLAHPHDNGGHSGIMNGVTGEGAGVADYTTGDFDLNQGVFTMMSYEDGWQTSPYGNAATNVGYGYLGGLMAFDIAAIQDKYGVNEDWATGDDVYVLKDVNEAGTYYSAIWDGGGTDAITYSGSRDATIDLRPATLLYESGGGGFVSYAYGIFGGFTIANAVTIENATSGDGDDTLIGNSVANVLSAAGGNDTIDGGAGLDTMYGGTGDDTYVLSDAADEVFEYAGQGIDTISAAISASLRPNVENLIFTGTADTRGVGNSLANVITGNSGANALYGMAGDDRVYGEGGNDVLSGAAGLDMLYGGTDNDLYRVYDSTDYATEAAGEGTDSVYATVTNVLRANIERLVLVGTDDINGKGNELDNVVKGNGAVNTLWGADGNDVIYGGLGDDRLFGNEGADALRGDGGDDWIEGGADRDVMFGGAGADIFVFRDGDTSAERAIADRIFDFSEAAGDILRLNYMDADSANGSATNEAFTFIGTNAFTGAAGELRYQELSGNTYVYGDTSGDGIADFIIFLDGSHTLTSGNFIL